MEYLIKYISLFTHLSVDTEVVSTFLLLWVMNIVMHIFSNYLLLILLCLNLGVKLLSFVKKFFFIVIIFYIITCKARVTNSLYPQISLFSVFKLGPSWEGKIVFHCVFISIFLFLCVCSFPLPFLPSFLLPSPPLPFLSLSLLSFLLALNF